MFTLVWTAAFHAAAERFVQQHPELRAKLAAVLRDLESDPFQPYLKYHSLSSKLKGFQAVSIAYSYRVILTLEIADGQIILHDIGSHDEMCR